MHSLSAADRVVIKYLLWGDHWPPVAAHEADQPVVAFNPPDVLIHVVDATTLQPDLELCFELSLLGKPLVIALNQMCIRDRSLDLCLEVAGQMHEVCSRLGLPYIFKASYDKANRSSGRSPRGPGLDAGLQILAEVRRQIGVPVLTDVHREQDIAAVASVVDVLQTPAFLCRQKMCIRDRPWLWRACAVTEPISYRAKWSSSSGYGRRVATFFATSVASSFAEQGRRRSCR